MLARIIHHGPLIHVCSLPGEGRDRGVFPAHPNGQQVRHDRWLLVYATRGWRGGDDDLSIIWQLRRDAPTGAVLREGCLARAVSDWDPFSDGRRLVRQHGHPVVFGVPAGATLGGRALPHAGVFVAKWRVTAPGALDANGLLQRDHDVAARTQDVEWVQFRLNAAGDDLVILQAAAPLRQQGYAGGDQVCADASLCAMNQSFVQAVPTTVDGSEWADVNHFAGGRLALLRYRFDAARGVYAWAATGPVFGDPAWHFSEASLAPCGDGWLVGARSKATDGTANRLTLWRLPALEAPPGPPHVVRELRLNAPFTLYRAADGALRLLTGDPDASPYQFPRNPLYTWELDPATLALRDRRVVFDAVAAGLMQPDWGPCLDMAKLLPHAGGARQWLLHRTRVRNLLHEQKGFPVISAAQQAVCSIHAAELEFAAAHPPAWELPTAHVNKERS